jgi:hypothetical protein
MSNENNEGIYTAVILDSRITDIFELVLDNFYERLDKRWNFMIFCTNNNVNFLTLLINSKFKKEKKRTTIIVIDIINHINIYDYNKLCTSETFYEMIPTEHLLLFQLDTLLSDKYHHNIYNFMKYDYVGAPWMDRDICGNGGLSLRRKSKMLEIINDENYDYNKNVFYHEDDFFCCYPNINLPEKEEGKTFSVESYYYDKPAGIHKAFDYLTEEQCKELMTHIPKLDELRMKFDELKKQLINQEDTYITNFFENYKVINFN